MVVTLNVLGQYGIRVNNPGNVQVETPSPSTLRRSRRHRSNSISPATPIATVGNQNVSVFGSNFVNGLTVTVFFPGGGSGTLSGSPDPERDLYVVCRW